LLSHSALARRVVLACLAAFALALALPTQAAGGLAEGFRTPPASARPWVYWFWLNGNITREGITADLEAMKRAGIGGVLIMEVDQGAPLGPAAFAGPEWRKLFEHVVSEAARLGLEVNMNNDAGWNGSGGPWITPDVAMQKLVWSETPVEGGKHFEGALAQPETVAGYYRDVAVLAVPTTEARLEDIAGKSALVRRDLPARADFPEAAADQVISTSDVIDLTKQVSADGRLTWDPPAGKWTVLRMGHTPTGAMNAPSPESGRGLECDKLSKEGSEAAFAGLMGKLIADSPKQAGKALIATHIDSWENGSQNWTARFPQEFERLRGYDLTSYLPAMTGRIVESTEQSERFLWDARQTVSDLLIANYAGHMGDLAREHGMRLSIEAYGDTTVDNITYAGRADEPMAEFWSWPAFGAAGTLPEMSSAAHVYGKPIVGAEAFTAGDGERWLGHPGNIKSLGDWAFCLGINRFVFHRYALQPWLNRPPGMSMGPWGLHYERTQTWWEQSKAWHTYLARCQYLLQQGLPVVDILCLAPEGAPRSFQPPPSLERTGYKADACSADALLTRARAEKGRIVFPDGMSYRVLSLANAETMTPELLVKLRELAEGGVTILGTPPKKAPGLWGYPRTDVEVGKVAKEVWGSSHVSTANDPIKTLAADGVAPDFACDRPLDFIHKRIGEADVYFVANTLPYAVNALCGFRVAGPTPELWSPTTGEEAPAPAFTVAGGVTRLPLRFEAGESRFVVFRPGARRIAPVVRVTREGAVVWPAPPAEKTKLHIVKALWGPAGDTARTKDITDQVQRKVDGGAYSFVVAELANEGDPAVNVVKTLRVEYEVAGRVETVVATDPERIAFQLPADAVPPLGLECDTEGRIVAHVAEAGSYEALLASGRTVGIRALTPRTEQIVGPWELRFPPGKGAPERVTLETLVPWDEHPEAGVRYFSGTASYRTSIEVPQRMFTRGKRVTLDLGRVEVIARVVLNGKDLGILWKAPFRLDVTDALHAGANTLEVEVTNLWPNRMIGDEQLPEDSSRWDNGTLKEWPTWLASDKPSPTGRFTFTSWRLWAKDSPLLPSGLIGPVQLVAQDALPITAE
jgi:hypothetical protein